MNASFSGILFCILDGIGILILSHHIKIFNSINPNLIEQQIMSKYVNKIAFFLNKKKIPHSARETIWTVPFGNILK